MGTDDIPRIDVIIDSAEDFDEPGVYNIIVRDIRGRLIHAGIIWGLKNPLITES